MLREAAGLKAGTAGIRPTPGAAATPAVILTVLYVLGLLLWQVLRRTVGEAVLPVMVLNYAGVWPFALTPLLAAWLGLSGGARALPLLAVPLALFALRYSPQFASRPPGGDGPSLLVLTHNVRYGNPRVPELAAVYLAAEADVLALQEVSPEQEVVLSRTLKAIYPYQSYLLDAGLAVYSRHPLLRAEEIPLRPWSAQRLLVEVGASRVVLVNAHLTPVGVRRGVVGLRPDHLVTQAAERTRQAEVICRALDEWQGPAVLACDCNAPENSQAYARIVDEFEDGFRSAGRGFGHTWLVPHGLGLPAPLGLPVLRLDYLFHRGGLAPYAVRVLRDSAGSDHLPVVAAYRWRTDTLRNEVGEM
ncbi:MAG: hypothetical protein HPY83_06415 [Anaerolineae bacterium]|nr:hypothetical protein [Anaerolineae bacterium]